MGLLERDLFTISRDHIVDRLQRDLIGNGLLLGPKRAGWSIHGLFLAAKAVALAAEQARPETALWSRLRGSALIGQGKPLRLFSPSVPFFTQFRNLLTQQPVRSEEHTSELQSLMRNSYAVFCLKKKIEKDNI